MIMMMTIVILSCCLALPPLGPPSLSLFSCRKRTWVLNCRWGRRGGSSASMRVLGGVPSAYVLRIWLIAARCLGLTDDKQTRHEPRLGFLDLGSGYKPLATINIYMACMCAPTAVTTTTKRQKSPCDGGIEYHYGVLQAARRATTIVLHLLGRTIPFDPSHPSCPSIGRDGAATVLGLCLWVQPSVGVPGATPPIQTLARTQIMHGGMGPLTLSSIAAIQNRKQKGHTPLTTHPSGRRQ
jgi:hypothetical protein